MKTKTFLLVCLFLSIGLTQLSAQNGKGGTNGTTTYLYLNDYGWTFPIFCEGALVDEIFAIDISLKSRDHYTDGKFVKGTDGSSNFKGNSTKTREVFNISIQERVENVVTDENGNWIGGTYYGHYLFKGNMGSHYFVRVKQDIETWAFLVYESNCH
jgi:hypothetical protein